LILYALFSSIIVGLWHFKYKRTKKDSNVGQSNDQCIGQIGLIVSEVTLENHGMINFGIPVMGAKSWMAISEDVLKVGDAAKIVSIEGNYLRVEKIVK